MNPTDARRTSLIAWYRGVARDLPWRGALDPWVVLVSEVMLQQTQASRVADRIGPFLEIFPTPETLARVGRRQVLAAWSGLGYNRRAIRLQEAARSIVAEGWPRSQTELQRLPGVGPYTAAAVACFAFGEQAAAVDVNVRRVLSRWVGKPLTHQEASALSAQLLPDGEAHVWTQALMDLGATICTSRHPTCDRCPCEPWCLDPGVMVASRPQSPFRGSIREARGALLRALGEHGSVRVSDLETEVDAARLHRAAADLEREGLIDVDCNAVTLREPLDTESGRG